MCGVRRNRDERGSGRERLGSTDATAVTQDQTAGAAMDRPWKGLHAARLLCERAVWENQAWHTH